MSKAPRSQFIQKLHEVLSANRNPEDLRWVANDSFEIISDDKRARNALAPTWEFRSLSSFIRQLSYYNFKRLSDRRRSVERRTGTASYIIFTHPSGDFMRDDKSRLDNICRKTRARKSQSNLRKASSASFDRSPSPEDEDYGYYGPPMNEYHHPSAYDSRSSFQSLEGYRPQWGFAPPVPPLPEAVRHKPSFQITIPSSNFDTLGQANYGWNPQRTWQPQQQQQQQHTMPYPSPVSGVSPLSHPACKPTSYFPHPAPLPSPTSQTPTFHPLDATRFPRERGGALIAPPSPPDSAHSYGSTQEDDGTHQASKRPPAPQSAAVPMLFPQQQRFFALDRDRLQAPNAPDQQPDFYPQYRRSSEQLVFQHSRHSTSSSAASGTSTTVAPTQPPVSAPAPVADTQEQQHSFYAPPLASPGLHLYPHPASRASVSF